MIRLETWKEYYAKYKEPCWCMDNVGIWGPDPCKDCKKMQRHRVELCERIVRLRRELEAL